MLSSTINFCIIATIVVYLLAMLAIGFVFSKNNSDSKDFYLGGRKMGPIVTAMSAEASDMSSWLLMGLPGLAYLTGVANPAWTAIGLGIATSKAVEAVARQPEAESKITKILLLGGALAEATAIYGFVIGILIILFMA